MQFDSIVIGGGFYGARLALALRAQGESVLLLEREPTLIARASLANQARVHHGYHYPRSILTSIRSRMNYDRFRSDYGEAVYESFDHYDAIARGSKTTAAQFAQFCKRVGAPLRLAPDRIRKLFDDSRIEDVVLVTECAFNALALRKRLESDLTRAGVEVRTGATAHRVVAESIPASDGEKPSRVQWTEPTGHLTVTSHRVFNCTYSSLNSILAVSNASHGTLASPRRWRSAAPGR